MGHQSARRLQARPIYYHKRDSIEAHLSIVFPALAISHSIQHQTGWGVKKFVRTARRYCSLRDHRGATGRPRNLRDEAAADVKDLRRPQRIERPHGLVSGSAQSA
jgi:hypothetical protein